MTPAHHLVIVGGGFGGLKAARSLKDAPLRITLVDRRNFHLFQPLLYQVARQMGAALSAIWVFLRLEEFLRLKAEAVNYNGLSIPYYIPFRNESILHATL